MARGPRLDLRAEPEHASTLTQVDDGAWHVGIPALVQADIPRLRQPEDLSDAARVDEVVGVHEWRHEASVFPFPDPTDPVRRMNLHTR